MGTWICYAQQIPVYQHSSLIRSSYNPAEVLNNKNEASVYLLRGNQFSKFDGGFENNYLSFTTPLKKDNIGIGLQLSSRSFGIINQLSANISYAYKAKINANTSITFGARFGFTEHKYNRYYLVVYNDNDYVINNIPIGNMVPNGNAGMSFQSKFGTLELSVPQLLSNGVLKFSTNSYQNIVLAPHLFTRYSINLGNDQKNIRFSPVISLRYMPNSLAQYEAGIVIWLKDMFWVNANYRSGYSASLGAGIRLKNTWTIGYSHDRPIRNVYNFYNSSHEFVLGYTFVREKHKKPIKDDFRTELKQPTRVLMDSISPKQELNIAREYLVLRLNQKQIQDSLDNIADGKTNGYNYKSITVQLNLIDSIFNVLDTSNDKKTSSRAQSSEDDTSSSKNVSKDRLKEISEEEILRSLNKGLKEEIKIVRNKQPNRKEYVELNGQDSPRGYYLITGVFSTLERAQKFRWQEGSDNSKIIINKTNKYFYVVEMYSSTKSLNELEKYMRDYLTRNKPMWVLDY